MQIYLIDNEPVEVAIIPVVSFSENNFLFSDGAGK
ncbi:hypothetical protein SAMN05192529_12739 [Arachidicoccus rhizosphaerae]|jgi:hypothetical protein|uniref:Uncharacterized protein n=1 Tax=Arachidicoccus rhizosphaerae TaxID=551991 RepID=A0A1H4C4W0_9BACT|nr:hypothetical protein SAMN05192529_12739 [Arachidicoccus rhizosphaerae]